MITLQDILDNAWQTFIVEDKPPSFGEDTCGVSGCMYLNDSGGRCAVGLCIPEGHELFEDQEKSLYVVVKDYPELFPEGLKELGEEYLNMFQSGLHDSLVDSIDGAWIFSNKDRAIKYIQIAKEYKLLPPYRNQVNV